MKHSDKESDTFRLLRAARCCRKEIMDKKGQVAGELTTAEKQFGIKLTNRCKNSFDGSQLDLVGGDSDGKKAKSPQIIPYMQRVLIPDMDLAQRAGFNLRLPEVYNAMLFLSNGTLFEEGYVEGIGGNDYGNIAQIGVDLAAEREASGVVTRLVFGGVEEMPLRAISYLLPPLIYAEQMKKLGIETPQLQVIFANNISSALNHLDQEKAKDQSIRFAEFAHDFIREYFPEVSDSVVFLEDTPLNKGSVIKEELLSVARVLDEHLSPEARESLLGKGNNGSARLNPFYGAAHLLIHDTNIPRILVPLVEGQPEVVNPKAIISFGGYQERLFYKVRQEIKPHLGSEYQRVPTLQYFTKHRVPPYYMARGGDYSLDDALQGVAFRPDSVATTAQKDLTYLESVISKRGIVDFADFIASHAERIAA